MQRRPSFRARDALDREAARLAEKQHGLVGRRQVVALGATRAMIEQRVASGRWLRLPGAVYRISGTPPTWHGALFAALVAYGGDALISWRSAAALWELTGFVEGVVEVTVPRSRGRIPGIIVHRATLGRADRAIKAGLPVTTPARTLIDVAAVVSDAELEEALDDALARRLVTLPRLRRRVGELSIQGRAGIARIRRILDRHSDGIPMSVFETRLLARMRKYGLPAPVLQHRIRNHGTAVAIVDFAYPEAMLAIEADGYRWHASPSRWRRDLGRRNVLMALGWRIVHVTWRDLMERPDVTIATIAAAYSQGIKNGNAIHL